MKFLLIVTAMIAIAFLMTGGVQAHESGYAPPPMFDAPAPLPPPSAVAPAPVIKNNNTTLIAPRVSPQVSYQEGAAPGDSQIQKMKPIVEGGNILPKRISSQTGAPKAAPKSKPVPVPPKKPQPPKAMERDTLSSAPTAPTSGKVSTPTTKVPALKPVTAPAAPVLKKSPAKPSVVSPSSSSKVKHDGFVTGPKTMPAVPTQNVDEIAVFAPDTSDDLTIMERHQRQVKAKRDDAEKAKREKEAAKKAAEETAAAAPEGYEKTGQQALKKILPYQAGQTDMAQEDMTSIAANLQSELAKRPDWRIQIRSFASAHGEGAGSDKRISLSRAMNFRKALLEQGVEPGKIDLRAEGAATDAGAPADRVDLYLFGPSKTAEKR